MSSLQDVFKAFEGEGGSASEEESFFHETFSQLKEPKASSAVSNERLPLATKASDPDKLVGFEEAFTVLKSIQAAHEPSSLTAITAFLHYRRGIQINRRTLQGLLWPEHPESFSSSRLLEASLAATVEALDCESQPEDIPQLYTESSESDGSEGESEEICEMTQSKALHKALVRVCQSIWRQKRPPPSSPEIDPHLSHAISRRASFLLQTVFRRALLNRRSAVKLLQSFPQNRHRDLDNVPVNWEDAREATKQTIGQAALDQDTFVKFKIRLEKLFKKHPS